MSMSTLKEFLIPVVFAPVHTCCKQTPLVKKTFVIHSFDLSHTAELWFLVFTNKQDLV